MQHASNRLPGSDYPRCPPRLSTALASPPFARLSDHLPHEQKQAGRPLSAKSKHAIAKRSTSRTTHVLSVRAESAWSLQTESTFTGHGAARPHPMDRALSVRAAQAYTAHGAPLQTHTTPMSPRLLDTLGHGKSQFTLPTATPSAAGDNVRVSPVLRANPVPRGPDKPRNPMTDCVTQ